MAEASSEFDVFATLGTFDAPFARMDELAALLARSGRRVLYQYGMASPKPAENLTAVRWLPFDEMTRRLRETPYSGALTLELRKKESYLEKSDEEFLAIANERIRRISELK